MEEKEFELLRKKMVEEQLIPRGITNPRILEAFLNVPRHKFVPSDKKQFAYEDRPLSIGWGQTISQPYIVALMTKHLSLEGGEKILEIGTGSGYQAAILSYLGCEVFTIERIIPLAEKAKQTILTLGYKVKFKIGDGTLGWQEYAPYDRIIITAATPSIPPPLLHQLKIGGKFILPLGESRLYQRLVAVIKKSYMEVEEKFICECVFVPLIGKYGHKR